MDVGFSDHINIYGVLFPTLARKGIKTYAFDQRGEICAFQPLPTAMAMAHPLHVLIVDFRIPGWGRSVREPKQRGLTGPNQQVMADITTFIKSLPEDEGSVPIFLMGHSMGGGEVLIYASTGPKEVLSKIRGFLLESPLISLPPSIAPWKPTVVLGKLAAKALPHLRLPQKLDPYSLSRDPEVCKAWDQDPLCHDTATLECLAGLMNRSDGLNGGHIVLQEGIGEGRKTRVWFGHGTDDGACDFEACRKYVERLRGKIDDVTFRVYEGWYHKLHTEPGNDKFEFANDVATWILDRSGTLGQMQHDAQKPKL